MRLAHAVRIGSWVLLALNLIMAVGTIAIVSRMAPAIAQIIDRNERSLHACQDMLGVLALTSKGQPFASDNKAQFQQALDRAQANITEKHESETIKKIADHVPPLFAGNVEARSQVMDNIVELGTINRKAMTVADKKAQHLGHTGAWGVAFMAMIACLIGVIFIRGLLRRVIIPLEEIYTVIAAQRTGDTMRRCTGVDLPQDITAVFTGINEILDQQQSNLPWHGQQKALPTFWPTKESSKIDPLIETEHPQPPAHTGHDGSS